MFSKNKYPLSIQEPQNHSTNKLVSVSNDLLLAMNGALSKELKSEIHKRVCQVMVETEGRGNKEFAKYVTVIIEEQIPENFSVGGQMANQEFVSKITSA